MTDSVKYDVDADGICTLTMDIPGKSMNTLGAELTGALSAAIRRAADDSAVRGIILASGKDGFIAGADLKEMDSRGDAAQESLSVEEKLEQCLSLSKDLRTLETCGKPVAVVVNGVAAGGGLEVVLACHYRIVANDPRIRLGLPEVGIGLLPGGGGTQRLPRIIGVAKALPLILEGKLITPQEALEAGFIDAVLPAEEMLAEAKRWLVEEGDPVVPWDKKGFKVPGGAGALSPSSAMFTMFTAQTLARSYGNLPAPFAAAAAISEGIQLPFDTALRVEGKYFVGLMESLVSTALVRTMFVSKQSADKLEHRPEGVEKRAHGRIGIIGAGTMGAGIALNAAKAKIEVVLIDTTLERANGGKAYAEKVLARDLEKGRTTQEKVAQTLARIHPSETYADLSDVSLVVEAVFESEKVKARVISQAEAHLPADAVFASNTSAIPITSLASYSERPDQFIGMHFFSPAERMPLVEIIRGERTSDETLAFALDFAQQLRKTPIVVNDSRGFFTSRFIGSFVAESLRMVEEGINPNLVENGARMLGMPMGALTVSDSIGLDVGFTAAQAQAEERGETFDPESLGLMGKLVGLHGRRGRKNGKGFYDYHESGSREMWAGLADLVPELDEQPSIDEVKSRILFAQLAEGARAFAEGVLPSPADGDLGATLGVGFPAYLGGPFGAMDNIGIAETLAELDRLYAAYGGVFEAPQLLRDMAASGETFYGANAVASPGRARTVQPV